MQIAQRLPISFVGLSSGDGSASASETGVDVGGTRLHLDHCWGSALAHGRDAVSDTEGVHVVLGERHLGRRCPCRCLPVDLLTRVGLEVIVPPLPALVHDLGRWYVEDYEAQGYASAAQQYRVVPLVLGLSWSLGRDPLGGCGIPVWGTCLQLCALHQLMKTSVCVGSGEQSDDARMRFDFLQLRCICVAVGGTG